MELCHETDWPHFVIRGVFSSWSFYERQSHKLARPIGWLGLYERKYSPLAWDEVLLNNFEPFLRISTSNIGMSCKLIAVYRHWPHFVSKGVFSYWSFYKRQSHKLARPIGWLGLYDGEIFSSSRRRSIVENFRAVFEKFDFKHRHVMSADRRISPYTAVSFYRSF